ncbi:MAG: hypothetical protein HS116_26260 [Planctomycetes bacterium]|nr:hypothetical protein [Planctomycetota bacterium]
MNESHHESSREGDAPQVHVFSFWKPDPVPPKDNTILPVELHSLGRIEDVKERLFEVPRIAEIPREPWEVAEASPVTRLRWQVDEGVILNVRSEQGPPKPGEVLTIRAETVAPGRTFYRLYVQIYEQLGVTVLDERSHQFLSPREFRRALAG